MNKKLWIIFAVVVIAGLVGLIIWQNNRDSSDMSKNVDFSLFKDANKTVFTSDNIPAGYTGDKYIATDNVGGKADSKVVVTEYADFQCPGCYALSPTTRAIKDKYGDRVAFVYRYFPLPYHNNGMASAVAAEAAARQGKFWEMNKILFENKPSWENASTSDRENIFAGYAQQIGLNVDQWRKDYQNYQTNGIKDKISFQQNLGKANGIDQTPSILVNGQLIESPTEESLSAAIDAALAKQ